MRFKPRISRASTTHVRKGSIKNQFTYGLSMVLVDPEHSTFPTLLRRGRWGLMAFRNTDYGSLQAEKGSVQWVKQQFQQAGLSGDFELLLLTQPRVLGSLFNPVSFWVARQDGQVTAFIAEVNNTFKQRHFYRMHHDDFAPIKPTDKLTARKLFYVSPFQDIAGTYTFQLLVTDERFNIIIDHTNGDQGVHASVKGKLVPMTNTNIVKNVLLYPLGSLRVVFLIFFHALKLKLKGASYRDCPKALKKEINE